jgi:hypothetical protein
MSLIPKLKLKAMTFSGNNSRSGSSIKSFLGIFILMLLMVSSLSAQTGSVNFSGSWAFNEAKSSPAEGGFRMGAGTYVITHDGNNLTVERTMARPGGEEVKTTSKYTLDGKECSNTIFGTTIQKSTVQWSGDGKSLTFSNTMNFEREGTTTEFKSTQTWKINDADKTLIMESVFNGQNGEVKTSNVYDKK